MNSGDLFFCYLSSNRTGMLCEPFVLSVVFVVDSVCLTASMFLDSCAFGIIHQETRYTPITIKKTAASFSARVLESSSSVRTPGINMPSVIT